MEHIQSEQFFTSHDGTELFYQHWATPQHSNKAIIMFHRGHEHSNRMKHIVEELGLTDYHFFAWDARGHGQSPGERGYAPNVGHVAKDIDTYIKYISSQYNIPIENMIVLGQSVGAVVLATWLHDYAPKVKAAILASPAFQVKLYVPFAIPSLKIFKKFVQKEHYINSYVKGAFLSHDPLRIEEYNTDPSITKPISIGMLVDLFDTAKRIVKDAGAIELPVLMLTSGNDFVVEKKPQYEFLAKLPSTAKEIYELPDFYHDTLGESNRALAFSYITNFIRKIEKSKQKPNDLTVKNKHHFSHIEVEQLSRESNPIEEAVFRLQSKALKFGSKFSHALKVGEETGYDSGSSLDYVYNNVATSDNPLGKIIDNAYLSAIGWKGIRIRKQNLEKAFQWVLDKINIQPSVSVISSKKTKTVQSISPQLVFADIAAGHGRYDIDFLKTVPTQSFRATLSDYSNINVTAGNELIAKNGLSENIKFVQGNAFDTQYVSQLTQNANLVVVSGLYELYPDNTLIEKSLAGISQGINSGGYLVYTNQPWHPQLKFIAKVLTSHREGESWIMRRRSQLEMDQLVEKHGFEKLEQFVDPYGIFTVSIAIKK